MKGSPQSEGGLLSKLRESFCEPMSTISMDEGESKAIVARELTTLLYSVDEDLVPGMLGFILIEYLENHPESLEEDKQFATLIYYLRGVVDDIAQGLPVDKPSDRLRALELMSLFQVEAVTQWIESAYHWKCSRRFQFDLEEAQTAWETYFTWRQVRPS